MNSILCLWLMSIGTRKSNAYGLNSTLVWTLVLSVFILNPSFADNELNHDVDVANFTLPTSTNHSTFAQTFKMPNDGKAITETISDCTAQNKFFDDRGDGGYLYEDSKARKDTIAICPNSPWQTTKIEFTNFDLAAGDTLIVYDGDLTALKAGNAPLKGKVSGYGASTAFGAWVAGNCSPAINPTGCLTFVLETNGDYAKGTGWETWATCIDRAIVVEPPSINNNRLDCDEISRQVTIGAATINAACGNISNDSTFVTIASATGVVCIDTILSKNQGMSVTEEFAIGSYIVTYKLKGDETKSAVTYFTVNEPTLVCNDALTIPLSSSCGIFVTPDMILENPCDTITDTMYYQIKIKTLTGQVLAEGTGRAGDYPKLTKDQLSLCNNNRLEVAVTRVYFEGLNLTMCNNGKQTNTCTTIVDFIDNTAPLFGQGSSTDTVYACDPVLSEDGLLLTKPIVIDNCSETTVVLKSASQIGAKNLCEQTTYLVTWEAKDLCGNKSLLRDTVRVMRPGKDKIIDAPHAILRCGEDTHTDALDLKRTGVPSLQLGVQKNGKFIPTDTIPLSTDNYVCNYILQKEDKTFNASCGTKYFRYWTLVDWCGNTAPVVIDTQVVVFKDTIAPVIQCAQYTTLETAEEISLSHFNCTKNINFTPPTVTDNCDLLPEVAMYTVERYESDGWWKLGRNLNQSGALGVGTYRVGYRAYDQCHEQIKEDSCFRYFVLEDNTKPTAVCTDKLSVSISNDYARIAATDIDGGSWDACGVERILVRRQACGTSNEWQGPVNSYVKSRLNNRLDPTGWSDYLDFECCDINQVVKVELLVIDRNGNYNFCWMEVETEDKIGPVCVNLPNQWDYCDNFHSGELGAVTDTDGNKAFNDNEWIPLEGDLADLYNNKYGAPFSACVDNLTCQQLTLEQQYQLIDMECGVYRAKRRYRVKDGNGNTSNWAEQYISIEYRPDWKITLPVDWTGTCGANVPEAELIIDNGACDALAYEAYDQRFEIVNDACFKVIRTYHIINWCNYKAGDTPININRISNVSGDVINKQTITSSQYANASYLTYTQILKVSDSDAPTVTVASIDDCISGVEGCNTTKTFSATATDCNDASNENLDFEWEIFENNISKAKGYAASFDWVVHPYATYKVKWKVADGCGNNAKVENTYTFKDCTNPSAYCLDGLAIELGTNKEVGIWAKDFDLNSTDNCTNQDKLEYRIWHASLQIEEPTTSEGVLALPTSVTLNCDFIGIQTVNVYVIDEAGNYGFCRTNMIVQDNMGVCPALVGSIAGRIYTEHGAAVQEAEVYVENMDNTMMMTQANGGYAFDVAGNANYTLIPRKNIAVLNGVSTYDMVKITKHILGKEPFTSPYQYIAADINGNGDVSTFDIIQMRKVILNLVTEFPDNNSWRFVDANYDFTSDNPANEAFPEFIEVNNLNGTIPDLDFIAVKIGDINGSATPSSFLAAEDREKDANLVLEIADQTVKAGEIVEVTFHAKNFQDIDGYQFTLNFKDLELIDFAEGVTTEANFSFDYQDRGYLMTSWHNTSVDQNVDAAPLFRLKFKANTNGNILSLFNITSDLTTAEAYRNDGYQLGVALQAQRSVTLLPTFGLGQNKPNPFTENTLINFELPETAAIELQILDIQGKVMQTNQGVYEQGQQQIEVSAVALPNGTYYYQLVTPFGVATKKMIVLK